MLTRDTEREQQRKDFDFTFMCDFVEGGSSVGHDPRNYIGFKCGVNPPRVYQVWGDYWSNKLAEQLGDV